MLDTSELILALVASCQDRPDFGRTTLQKLAYLSTTSMGWGRVGHQAYYYGPFSRPLERETARLVSTGLLEEHSQELGFVGTGGFAARRYSYRLTEAGSEAVESLERRRPEDLAELRDFVGRVQSSVGSLDQSVLSIASKVHYIVEANGTPLARSQLTQQAKELGWAVSEAQIDRVVGVLEELGLVKQAPEAT